MKVFVAHTDSDSMLAEQIVRGLRRHGFNASSGKQVSRGFSASSFADKSVAKAIRAADCMVAVSAHYTGFKYIVPEMAFFAGNSTVNNTVIVTTSDCLDRIPPFLLESKVLLIEEHDADSLVTSIVPLLAKMVPATTVSSKQIFLSYSRVDLEKARRLHEILVDAGYKVWFDERSLIGGQDWGRVIEDEIRASGVFLSLFSERALKKRGVFQRELRQALRVAEEMPHGAIFVIPAAINYEALRSMPSEIAKYHCIVLNDFDFLSRDLFRALDFALKMD
jgi:hypothetical protein